MCEGHRHADTVSPRQSDKDATMSEVWAAPPKQRVLFVFLYDAINASDCLLQSDDDLTPRSTSSLRLLILRARAALSCASQNDAAAGEW